MKFEMLKKRWCRKKVKCFPWSSSSFSKDQGHTLSYVLLYAVLLDFLQEVIRVQHSDLMRMLDFKLPGISMQGMIY